MTSLDLFGAGVICGPEPAGGFAGGGGGGGTGGEIGASAKAARPEVDAEDEDADWFPAVSDFLPTNSFICWTIPLNGASFFNQVMFQSYHMVLT